MVQIAILANALSGGGAESAANTLHREFDRQGLKSILIGINSENPNNISLSEKVVCLDRDKKSIISTYKAFIKLSTVLRINRITKIIVNCELPELYAALLPNRIELFIVEQANPSWYKRSFLGFIVRQLLVLRKSKFIVTGSHVKPRFIKNGNPTHIPNPLELQELQNIIQPGSEIKRLIFVGRLSRHFKNPQTLLEIGLKTKLPILFIGEGELKGSLFEKSKEFGVDAEFLGFQSNPWEHYRRGDLLIVPSSAEGDGLVMIEAIKYGVPFLAQDIPDLNRYGLNQVHYCHNLLDYEKTIQFHRYSLGDLVVPKEKSYKLVLQRNPQTVVMNWKKVLNFIC